MGLLLPVNTRQHLSIFVIQLLEENEALYKPCSALDDLTVSPYVLFTCNEEKGLWGEFIYIRDERPEAESFELCEVEIFSVVEEEVQCGSPDSPAGGSVRTFEGVARYECEEGRRMVRGNVTRTCQQGTWDGEQPVCQGQRRL